MSRPSRGHSRLDKQEALRSGQSERKEGGPAGGSFEDRGRGGGEKRKKEGEEEGARGRSKEGGRRYRERERERERWNNNYRAGNITVRTAVIWHS